MSLLSFSATPEKDATVTVTLGKVDLLNLAEVSSNPYWSTTGNILRVEVLFSASETRQKKLLDFDFSQAEPSAALSFSSKASGLFQVSSIVLIGSDQGSLRISRKTCSPATNLTLSEIIDIELD
jgi:hypothetical protein